MSTTLLKALSMRAIDALLVRAPQLVDGAHARIHGLKSRPDLNGVEVSLLRYDPASERWETQNVVTGVCLKIKAANLQAHSVSDLCEHCCTRFGQHALPVGSLCEPCVELVDWHLTKDKDRDGFEPIVPRTAISAICDACGQVCTTASLFCCPTCQVAVYCSPECLANRLSPGSKATIVGLAKAVQWNGRVCVLEHIHAEAGRWVISIDGSDSNILVKPENLHLLHESVWSPHHNNRAMNLALMSAEAAEAAAELRMTCRPYGFRRVAQYQERVLPQHELAAAFQDYAVVYYAGVGRWDRTISLVGSGVRGLSTYGLRTCVAVCIADSLEKPKRCSLIHSSLALDVPSQVVEEVKWVAEATAGGLNRVQLLVLKGFRYRMPFMDVVRGELRWELADAFLPRVRAALDQAQLQQVELILEHEPLYSGVVGLGHEGLILPTMSATPPHKLLGRELSLHHIAARHSAMSSLAAKSRASTSAQRPKLDLQFDGVKHVDPTNKELADIFQGFRHVPLNALPNAPLCAF